MSADKNFTALTDSEVEVTLDQGLVRKWVAGAGQTVTWAKCDGVRLYRKNADGQWIGVEDLQNSMRGLLLRNWAIQFLGGRIMET